MEREEENAVCLGGMRDPQRAVAKSPDLQTWGSHAAGALDEVLQRNPRFITLVDQLGTEVDAQEAGNLLEVVGKEAAQALAKSMGMPEGRLVTGSTGWRWRVMAEICKQAKDPDIDVPAWFQGQTPLGILDPIVSRGVFPGTGPTKAQMKSEEYLQERGEDVEIEKNYASFHEHEAESQAELQRLIKAGHVEVIGSWQEVVKRWPNARATKIATLVKARQDGTHKIRFIVDMLRSGVNALTKAEERIVLPRGADLVRDILDLLECRSGPVEILTADFSDAFLNLGIKERERGNVVIRTASGTYAAYAGVPFGLATAPLLWGRAAAWLGRTAQALHNKWDQRMQIYVDDPALVARGSRAQRTWTFARTLLYWAALGAKIALHKVERGHQVKWIGAVYAIRVDGVKISVDEERIAKLTKVVSEALQARGLVPGVRSLAGELSWVAGIVPTTRPFVNMLWGALTGMNAQNEKARKSKQRARPVGSVLAPMIQLPLTWFQKFLNGEQGGLQRIRLLRDRFAYPSGIIRTDASTTGAGGILLTPAGKPVRWWAHPFTPDLMDPLGVKAGDPGKMTTYEILALLISLRTWGACVRNHRIGVLVQLDSESALQVATKMASPHPVVNRLAAELALCVENLRLETLTGQHWRNVVNIEADALSRLQEGYAVPLRLQKLPRDEIVPTSELFFLPRLLAAFLGLFVVRIGLFSHVLTTTFTPY